MRQGQGLLLLNELIYPRQLFNALIARLPTVGRVVGYKTDRTVIELVTLEVINQLYHFRDSGGDKQHECDRGIRNFRGAGKSLD